MKVCREIPLFKFAVNLSLFSEDTYWLIFVETRFGGARSLLEMSDKLEKFEAVHAHIALQLRDSVEVKVREVVVFANLDPAKQTTRTDQEGSSIYPSIVSSSLHLEMAPSRHLASCHLVISPFSSYPFIFLLTQICRSERPCEEA